MADLQDRLGAINDHVTAERYLVEWRTGAESRALAQAFNEGVEHECRALEASRQEFLAWWTTDRRQDLRRRFEQYVTLDDCQK